MSLSVTNGFDSILVKHFARSVADRMALVRLLSVIDSTETLMLDSKKSVLMQALYRETAQPLIRVSNI